MIKILNDKYENMSEKDILQIDKKILKKIERLNTINERIKQKEEFKKEYIVLFFRIDKIPLQYRQKFYDELNNIEVLDSIDYEIAIIRKEMEKYASIQDNVESQPYQLNLDNSQKPELQQIQIENENNYSDPFLLINSNLSSQSSLDEIRPPVTFQQPSPIIIQPPPPTMAFAPPPPPPTMAFPPPPPQRKEIQHSQFNDFNQPQPVNPPLFPYKPPPPSMTFPAAPPPQRKEIQHPQFNNFKPVNPNKPPMQNPFGSYNSNSSSESNSGVVFFQSPENMNKKVLTDNDLLTVNKSYAFFLYIY